MIFFLDAIAIDDESERKMRPRIGHECCCMGKSEMPSPSLANRRLEVPSANAGAGVSATVLEVDRSAICGNEAAGLAS